MDFNTYKWKFVEDKKQTFITNLESYLQDVREKLFNTSAEDHLNEALEFLQQPFPDIKGSGSGKSRQGLEERLKFLEKKSETHKQQMEEIEKKHQEKMEKMEDKMKEQEIMTSEQKEEIEKMEKGHKEMIEKMEEKVKEQERRSASSVDELKNSFSELQRNMEEEGNKLEKLERKTDGDSKKRTRQIKEMKSNHKTVMRVCSERLASVGGIMKTVIQLHTATGTAFPTHVVAGPSSGVTTQATPTHAVAGPSSGVTTQGTPTQAVAGVTTQAILSQATAASPGLSASAALTTSPAQDRTPTAVELLNTFTLDGDFEDLLLLADSMLLVAKFRELKLYDLSGTQLQTMSTSSYGYCSLCKDGDGTVFTLDNGSFQLECLEVDRKDIKVKTTCRLSTGKEYCAITALDKTLAVSYQGSYDLDDPCGVDIIDSSGAVLQNFATYRLVIYMCTLPGGDLICSDLYYGISRWNPTTGKSLFHTEVPEIPDPRGVASLPSRTILVGGGNQGTLSLIDERGNFIRHLHKSPSGGTVYQVSVQDDKCIFEIYIDGRSSVQVIKLLY